MSTAVSGTIVVACGRAPLLLGTQRHRSKERAEEAAQSPASWCACRALAEFGARSGLDLGSQAIPQRQRFPHLGRRGDTSEVEAFRAVGILGVDVPAVAVLPGELIDVDRRDVTGDSVVALGG